MKVVQHAALTCFILSNSILLIEMVEQYCMYLWPNRINYSHVCEHKDTLHQHSPNNNKQLRNISMYSVNIAFHSIRLIWVLITLNMHSKWTAVPSSCWRNEATTVQSLCGGNKSSMRPVHSRPSWHLGVCFYLTMFLSWTLYPDNPTRSLHLLTHWLLENRIYELGLKVQVHYASIYMSHIVCVASVPIISLAQSISLRLCVLTCGFWPPPDTHWDTAAPKINHPVPALCSPTEHCALLYVQLGFIITDDLLTGARMLTSYFHHCALQSNTSCSVKLEETLNSCKQVKSKENNILHSSNQMKHPMFKRTKRRGWKIAAVNQNNIQ